ncbi:MAG: CGNR zinc finger domain-containing protein [Solirubrobacterales bacterium]|nr:CGNR zinc finger domain-containing protein [Solirubrobacterales bacterium]
MTQTYAGPLQDEPLAIELHNTLYASGGQVVDGLATETNTRAWLDALADRLPSEGNGRLPSRAELLELRDPVREALHAAMDGDAPSRSSLEIINRISANAPRSPMARWRPGTPPVADVDLHGASRAAAVLAAFAADTIDLLTGPRRDALRACGASGCMLLFLKNHPRREWCSAACGNRARQARHYARARARHPRP